MYYKKKYDYKYKYSVLIFGISVLFSSCPFFKIIEKIIKKVNMYVILIRYHL